MKKRPIYLVEADEEDLILHAVSEKNVAIEFCQEPQNSAHWKEINLYEPEKVDATVDLLTDIISWEKDLSEYGSLEGILRERYIITKRL